MQIQIESQPFAAINADALVTYVFDKDDRIEGVVADLDKQTGGKIAPLAKSGELNGKPFEMVLLHYPARPRRATALAYRSREVR